MLQFLSINNYALIQSQEIEFPSGFSVITGETGAGKSILLGALGLVLGNRADVSVAFDPEKKCVVEAHFSTKGFDFAEFFQENDIDCQDDNSLILRREILPGGKSRAFINDTPATLVQLREIARHLIDIHSQHQTLTLNSSRFQCRLLDSYSQDGSALDNYRKAYDSYTRLSQRYHSLETARQKEQDDREYNQFLYDELDQMKLKEGEQANMEKSLELLSKAEFIKGTLVETVSALDGDDFSMRSRLESVVRSLRKIAPYHTGVDGQMERWNSILVELTDMCQDLQAWAEEGDMDPALKEIYEERLDRLYRLEKKHHVDDVDDLIRIREDLRRKLESLESAESDLLEMKEELGRLEKDMLAKAQILTQERKKTARVLEAAIMAALAELGMEKSVLKIEVEESRECAADGMDRVNFLFSANPGMPVKEISKVASGGELSRLMLAIKSVIHQNSLLGTLILDEIDTGVSGKVAGKVAGMMKEMGKYMQVIAITHLPQIAAAAGSHYYVYKTDEGGRTVSRIRTLSEPEHIRNIASMLSNEDVTDAAIKAAEALVKG